jgi:hypothetical protein
MRAARAGKSSWNKGIPRSVEAKAKRSATLKDKPYLYKGKNNGAYKHGLEKIPLYHVHITMMHRCYNVKNGEYARYGKLGVSVWEPWHDVRTFIFGIEALLGPRPIGYSLDRINPHGDYVEWNVRLADRKTQRENQRENVDDYYSQCGEH